MKTALTYGSVKPGDAITLRVAPRLLGAQFVLVATPG
jgi:hypothetical protein